MAANTEYAVSSSLRSRGDVPLDGSEAGWQRARDMLMTHADVFGRVVAVRLVFHDIDEAQSRAPVQSGAVRVGWLRSMLNSITGVHARRCLRRTADVLVSAADDLFTAVSEMVAFDGSLEMFTRMYEILEGGNRVHPLTKFELFASGAVFGVVALWRPTDALHSVVSGLRNQGNTCFMNTALQCLMNCHSLSEFFLAKEHEGILTRGGCEEKVVEAYANLVSDVFDACVGPLTPCEVKDAMGAMHEEYLQNEEQDVVEFAVRLLDALHEGLNQPGSEQGWWGLNRSIITDLFFFKLRSALRCCRCGGERVSVDPAVCLSLPIPPSVEYKSNIVLFRVCGTSMRTYAEASLNVDELKTLLRMRHGMDAEILCVRYHGNRSMEVLGDDVCLGDVANTVFCYEYLESKLDSYYWVHVKTRRMFIDRSFEFNLLVSASQNSEAAVGRAIQSALLGILPPESMRMLDEDSLSAFFSLDLPLGNPRTPGILHSPMVTATNRNEPGRRLFDSYFNPLDALGAVEPPVVGIQQCLEDFLKSETISAHCDSCGDMGPFAWQTAVEDPPKYLIVQLKRFEYIHGVPKKISTFVDYPLDEFLFCGARYRVASTCNHDSDRALSSGHYVAHVWKAGWNVCNDHVIRAVDRISKDHTYALFLERL